MAAAASSLFQPRTRKLAAVALFCLYLALLSGSTAGIVMRTNYTGNANLTLATASFGGAGLPTGRRRSLLEDTASLVQSGQKYDNTQFPHFTEYLMHLAAQTEEYKAMAGTKHLLVWGNLLSSESHKTDASASDQDFGDEIVFWTDKVPGMENVSAYYTTVLFRSGSFDMCDEIHGWKDHLAHTWDQNTICTRADGVELLCDRVDKCGAASNGISINGKKFWPVKD